MKAQHPPLPPPPWASKIYGFQGFPPGPTGAEPPLEQKNKPHPGNIPKYSHEKIRFWDKGSVSFMYTLYNYNVTVRTPVVQPTSAFPCRCTRSFTVHFPVWGSSKYIFTKQNIRHFINIFLIVCFFQVTKDGFSASQNVRFFYCI